MTKLRHQQPSLWHPGLTKDIEDLWEPWMRRVDRLLEDEQLRDTIYEAQGERYAESRRRGREQTPAEVVLRLLLLKHIRNWSYDTLEREGRANLVYRAFTGHTLRKICSLETTSPGWTARASSTCMILGSTRTVRPSRSRLFSSGAIVQSPIVNLPGKADLGRQKWSTLEPWRHSISFR
jgi:hypothetical protein